VNPKKTGTVVGARILENSVNYYWRELKVKEEMEGELMDAVLAGNGWHKCGIGYKTIGSGETLKIEQENLYSNRISWRDMIWNIGSMNPPRDCIWMAQRIIRPTYMVKNKYGAKAAGLKGGPHPSVEDKRYKDLIYKDDLNYSVVYEIWDAEERQILTMADGYDKWLKPPMEWEEYMDEFPFNRLYFSLVPDEPWAMPDILPWEPQILESIKLLAMLLNHVKRWNRMLLGRKGAVDKSNLDKMMRGVDGAYIEVNTASKPIGEIVQPLAYAQFQPEVYNLLNILDALKKNINGQPAFARGAPERTQTRTLGELQRMEAGARGRENKKLDRLETHIENIARHMIAYMKSNFDLPKTVQITGEMPENIIKAFGDKYDPVSQSITFTKEDIQGEYDVEVKAGSTLPMDKQTRLSLLEKVLGYAAKLMTVPMLPPFVEQIIVEMLRDIDIKSLEKAFEMQRQAAARRALGQSKKEMIDMEKTKAEADKRNAQAAQIRTETTIQGAEALMQGAQAGALPEIIEFGRVTGQFPMDDEGGAA
jgi:hypothetical protein